MRVRSDWLLEPDLPASEARTFHHYVQIIVLGSHEPGPKYPTASLIRAREGELATRRHWPIASTQWRNDKSKRRSIPALFEVLDVLYFQRCKEPDRLVSNAS
jgi:hypothetical protein